MRLKEEKTVLAAQDWLSKTGKAVSAPKKPFTAKPVLDNSMDRFPKAEIAGAKTVPAVFAKA
jgi:hypothetical protein